MSPWKVLIVDDEALARSNLQLALAAFPSWQCVASCGNTASARAALAQGDVDLVLLDIRMPRQTGLSFARELCALAQPPLVVFVTAFDEYALSAFDVFALDYLLKPFDDKRFATMLNRVEQALLLKQNAAYAQAMGGFLMQQQALAAGHAQSELHTVTVRSVGVIERIHVFDIEWIGAAGNYIELHIGDRVVLHRATLNAMEDRLPAGQFLRVHRAVMVRCAALCALAVTGDGTYQASLRSGATVPVSERYVDAVRACFQ